MYHPVFQRPIFHQSHQFKPKGNIGFFKRYRSIDARFRIKAIHQNKPINETPEKIT